MPWRTTRPGTELRTSASRAISFFTTACVSAGNCTNRLATGPASSQNEYVILGAGRKVGHRERHLFNRDIAKTRFGKNGAQPVGAGEREDAGRACRRIRNLHMSLERAHWHRDEWVVLRFGPAADDRFPARLERGVDTPQARDRIGHEHEAPAHGHGVERRRPVRR